MVVQWYICSLFLEVDLKFQNHYGYEFLIEEKFKVVRFG